VISFAKNPCQFAENETKFFLKYQRWFCPNL